MSSRYLHSIDNERVMLLHEYQSSQGALAHVAPGSVDCAGKSGDWIRVHKGFSKITGAYLLPIEFIPIKHHPVSDFQAIQYYKCSCCGDKTGVFVAIANKIGWSSIHPADQFESVIDWRLGRDIAASRLIDPFDPALASADPLIKAAGLDKSHNPDFVGRFVAFTIRFVNWRNQCTQHAT